MGVIGMKLEEKDTVIGMQLDSQGESLLIVSAKGMGKKSRMGNSALRIAAARELSATRSAAVPVRLSVRRL